MLANETIDPETKKLSHSQCGNNTNCRYSDSTASQTVSTAADFYQRQDCQAEVTRIEGRPTLPEPHGASGHESNPPMSGTTVYYVGRRQGMERGHQKCDHVRKLVEVVTRVDSCAWQLATDESSGDRLTVEEIAADQYYGVIRQPTYGIYTGYQIRLVPSMEKEECIHTSPPTSTRAVYSDLSVATQLTRDSCWANYGEAG